MMSKKKITNISDLTTERYLNSIEKREYGTEMEIDGVEYSFKSDSNEELTYQEAAKIIDDLIETKRREIKSKKRDNKIDDIIK